MQTWYDQFYPTIASQGDKYVQHIFLCPYKNGFDCLQY